MTRKHAVVITGAAFLLSALLQVGCSGKQAAAGGFTPPPTPVETATVTASTVTDRFDAVGTIEAIDAVTIVSEIDALVKSVPFREGASIQKGQVIAQLDDAQLRAQQVRAQALRDQKQITYDRIKSLADRGAVPPQEYDDASAALKVADAELQMINASLAKTRIVAPFSGVTGARLVSPGAFVRAGTPITNLVSLKELKVTFAAPERYYPLLKNKSQVAVSTTAYPDYQLTGTIEVIEPSVDFATRSARIVAHVPNPDLRFRPGMSANVSAILNQRENALLIPDEAVFAEGDQSLVFIVKPDSTVARTPIQVGSRQRETVEVVGGLQPGMTVVKAGHQKLFDGAKVMPVPSQSAQVGGTPQGGAQ